MIFQILTAISAFISLLLTIYAYNMKHSKYTVIFALLMSEITIFTLGSYKELMVNDDTVKVLWSAVSQTCFLLTVPTLLILIIIYIGKENILKPIMMLGIYFFPVLGVLLQWMDPYYHMMRNYIYIDKGSFAVNSAQFALFIMVLEFNIILVVLILLLHFHKQINVNYKKQTLTMGIGILATLIASIYIIVKSYLGLHVPFIAITLSITGIILFFSIFRYQLFSIAPITRDKIFDIVQEGIISVDNYGVIIDKNAAADKFIYDTSGENQELIGGKLEDFLLNWPRWYQSCKSMKADEFEIDALKWGRKRYYYVKVYPVYNNNRKKRGTISVLIDITNRKMKEEELSTALESNRSQLVNLSTELSDQKLQVETIINTISDIACLSISDKQGNLIYYSKAVKDYFLPNIYIVKDKIINTYHKGVYYYEDGREIQKDKLPLLRVLRGEKVVNFHFIMKNAGEDKHLLFNGTPIYSNSGSLTHGVYFIMDITDNILHRNLLAVTEQLKSMNALKDKLFTVFTHDIRNPIATMVSLVDILEQDNEWYNTDCTEILEEVKKQINYTYNIIENLLEWLNSQREGLVIKPSLWNLTEILQETISMYLVSAGVKKISIFCNVNDKLTIFADKEVLELVLRNLLSNAIKFTELGGNIWVEAYLTTNDTIIAVKDSGIGMDKNKLSQLFDEGYVNSTLGTAGEKGIGLGLLICKEFIMKGGGKIWAESKPGVGSTFYISLLNSNKKL
ncbi:sensor histidine kinase [Anaerocolumna sp. MB42-C2]|uniref:sensor histidine kinase n=1 Tax=Anaerocolumna sp. MB42-C2 TaxID=3070997 RepID=UPI0027DF98F8|nr:histidine kinase N-terminal 7TM domain-containing protein [Anaerocolumna sp. MB42-C2]WMJ89544.1 histidine kinase N-terminal 7TM domain-containing protein [Anaerocolumna sp. MB42-C2]